MYWNNKGYMLLNTLFSFSLFLTLTLSLLPMINTTYKEQMILEERRYWLYTLHDELKRNNQSSSLPITTQLNRNEQTAIVTLSRTSSLVKGCIKWQNERGKQERECLYAKP